MIAGSALLVHGLGPAGALVGATLAGFANAQAGVVSAGALYLNGDIDLHIAGLAVLATFTANTLTKGGISIWVGGWPFALKLIPGLVLMVAAGWAGLLLKSI